MDKVINLGIPHIGELIFESIDTDGLFQCLSVSETWKVLAENFLMKRWKSRMFEACIRGVTQIVKLLLERGNCENELNCIYRGLPLRTQRYCPIASGRFKHEY